MPREKEFFRENLMKIEEMFPGKGMLTVIEVAKWLNLDRHKVSRLIREKRLPAANVGVGKNNVYRISVEALARFSS